MMRHLSTFAALLPLYRAVEQAGVDTVLSIRTPTALLQSSPNHITKHVLPLTRGKTVSTSSTVLQLIRENKRVSQDTTSRIQSTNVSIKSIEGSSVLLAPLTAGGQTFQVVIDTGSSDTWLVSTNFTCVDPATYKTMSQTECYFAEYYTPSSTFNAIPDVNFNISYSDGEVVSGIFGYENLTLAGIQIPQQEMAVVDYAAWYGDGYSSGLVGLAYSLLTNAYPGTDPHADVPGSETPYNPIFTTLYTDNLTAPIFSLALVRDAADSQAAISSSGYLGIGGSPNIPHDPVFVSTPIDIVGTLSIGQPVYEFYQITVDGWAISNDSSTQFNLLPTRNVHKQPVLANDTEVIVDSGTSLVYVPDDVAAATAGLYDPPATYSEASGLYTIDCDATPPAVVGVAINKKIFYINSAGLIVALSETMCATGLQPSFGGNNILGDVFLRNVIAVFDVGAAEPRFAARQYTGV